MVSETFVDIVQVAELPARLGLGASLDYRAESLVRPLAEWKAEVDDAPILRFLFRHLRPARHLELGMLDVASACLCLEECEASVWLVDPLMADPDQNVARRTASRDAVGDFYRSAGYGHRMWQVDTDGRGWDPATYPPGFFDSVLIDGGPTIDAVSANSRAAVSVVRPGGLIVWRDFCPDPLLFDSFGSVAVVVNSILRDWSHLSASLQEAFWIRPSFLLAAIRR